MLVSLSKLQEMIGKLTYFKKHHKLPNHEIIEIESNINLIKFGSARFRSTTEYDLLLVSQLLHNMPFQWKLDYSSEKGILLYSTSLNETDISWIKSITNSSSFKIMDCQL